MVNDISNLNLIELQGKAVELKKRLAELRFEKATGKLIDTSVPSKTKRELARVLTRVSQVVASQGLAK
jgi:ribosomal protein L29